MDRQGLRRPEPNQTVLVARERIGALISGMTTLFVSKRRSMLLPVAAVAALATAGCSSTRDTSARYTANPNGSSPSTGASSRPSSPTTARPNRKGAATTTTGQNAQLRSAVRAFWDLYLRLGGDTGPFDGTATRRVLAARTTGAELNRLLAYFSSSAASGYIVRGTVDIAPRVVSVAGATAQVRDCYDDKTGLYRIINDQRVDADNPLRHRVLMTFVLANGVWKASAISDEGDGCRA